MDSEIEKTTEQAESVVPGNGDGEVKAAGEDSQEPVEQETAELKDSEAKANDAAESSASVPEQEEKPPVKQEKSTPTPRPLSASSGKKKKKKAPAVPVPEVLKDKVSWGMVLPPLFALLVFVLAVHFAGLFGDFVFNDVQNFRIANGVQNQADTFWYKLWTDGVLHPLQQPWVISSYAMDIKSLGWQSVFCHFVNLILHLVSCAYLYALVFRLTWRFRQEKRLDLNPYVTAFAAALFFGVHPLTVGVVTYVSGRSAALLVSSYLLAVDLFLFGFLSQNVLVAALFYTMCFVATTLALFSNAQAVTIPLTILVVALLTRDPGEKWKEWLGERWYELALFSVVAVCLPCVLFLGAPRLIDNGVGLKILSTTAYLASQCKAMVTYYLRGLILPFGLTVDPPMVQAAGFSDPLALVGLLFIISCIAALWFVRSQPLMFLGFFIFLIGFVPNSFMVQAELVGDHRIYLSLAGVCIILANYFARLFPSQDSTSRGVLDQGPSNRKPYLILGTTAAVLAGLTVWATLTWRNDITLWKAALQLNPDSARAHAMMARALWKENKPEEALKEVDAAIKLDPESAIAYGVRADNLINKGDKKGGSAALLHAISAAEHQGMSAQEIAGFKATLAQAHDALGNWKEAREMAQEAMKELPDDAKLHLIVGKGLLRQKQWYEAYHELMEGFRRDQLNAEYLEPITEAALNSGLAQLVPTAYMAGKRASQITLSKKAALLYGRAALEMGKLGEAARVIGRVAGTDPHDAEAYYLLAECYKYGNNPEFSKKCMQTAKFLNPNIEKEVPLYMGKEAKEASKAEAQKPSGESALPGLDELTAPEKPDKKAASEAPAPPANGDNQPLAPNSPADDGGDQSSP